MSKPFKDRTRSHRRKTKQQLLDIADEIKYRRFDDGRITAIDVFKKGALIHRSTAFYTTIAGVKNLTEATGKFQEEIFRSAASQQTVIVRNPILETRRFKFGDIINAGETLTLFDLPGRDVEIIHLEIGCNNKDLRLEIAEYNVNGDLVPRAPPQTSFLANFISLASVTASLNAPTPAAINLLESILFYELIFDETNDKYKFGIGYPLRYGSGARVLLRSPIGSASSASAVALVLIRG